MRHAQAKSNTTDRCKLWNDTVIETRLKTQREHLTVLAVYGRRTEGREGLNGELYGTLQKVLDKVNRNGYIMLIGDMSARVGNNRVANIVG